MGKTNFDRDEEESIRKSTKDDMVKETGRIVNELRKLISDIDIPPDPAPSPPEPDSPLPTSEALPPIEEKSQTEEKIPNEGPLARIVTKNLIKRSA